MNWTVLCLCLCNRELCRRIPDATNGLCMLDNGAALLLCQTSRIVMLDDVPLYVGLGLSKFPVSFLVQLVQRYNCSIY